MRGGYTIGKVSPDELIEHNPIRERYDKKIYFLGYIDYLDKIGNKVGRLSAVNTIP